MAFSDKAEPLFEWLWLLEERIVFDLQLTRIDYLLLYGFYLQSLSRSFPCDNCFLVPRSFRDYAFFNLWISPTILYQLYTPNIFRLTKDGMRLQRVHLLIERPIKAIILLLDMWSKDGFVFAGRSDDRVEVVIGYLVLLLPRGDVVGWGLELGSFVLSD